MVENHDELANAASGRRLQWTRLCARFAEVGLTDANGNPASERTARKTWERVRRAVAEARELTVAKQLTRPKRKYPSRISPDWRPQVASAYDGWGASIEPARGSTRAAPHRASAVATAAASAGTQTDGPMVFSSVDAEGNPIEEGKVFYRGRVMTRQAAEQLERLRRGLQEEDRFR
jgi:hypothetical protein